MFLCLTKKLLLVFKYFFAEYKAKFEFFTEICLLTRKNGRKKDLKHLKEFIGVWKINICGLLMNLSLKTYYNLTNYSGLSILTHFV
jgi:hypothetical protein